MDTPTTPGSERRRSPRLRTAKGAARVICQRGELFLGPSVAEALVDASEEGIGILSRAALTTGERVSIVLDGVGNPAPIQRLGRVAWCAPGEDGLFRAGVELDAPLEYAELMSIASI